MLVVGNGLPAGSGFLFVARILLDIAGICFVLLALVFAFADISGRVRGLRTYSERVAYFRRYPRHYARDIDGLRRARRSVRYPRHIAVGVDYSANMPVDMRQHGQVTG